MLRILSLLGLLSLVTACNGNIERNYKDYHPETGEDRRMSKMDSIITKSKEPIMIYGGRKSSSIGSGNATGVGGSTLWKAALESISFMPLISSDSNGGAIITDWYSTPESPNEKFKFNIFILSPEMQVNSIKVTAFKQVKDHAGGWRSVQASSELARSIEDTILQKAISLNARATQ